MKYYKNIYYYYILYIFSLKKNSYPIDHPEVTEINEHVDDEDNENKS